MRGSKPILAGLLGLTAIAACGVPPATRDGAPSVAAGTYDAARRYAVLETNPICTPTPGACDAFAGRGGSILFTVVDDGPGTDLGQVQFGFGEFEYVATNPTVEQDVDTFNNPIVRISATFTAIYTGPTVDPTPTADPVAATITVNLNGPTYTRHVEEDPTFEESGNLQVLLVREDTCTQIPTTELFE